MRLTITFLLLLLFYSCRTQEENSTSTNTTTINCNLEGIGSEGEKVTSIENNLLIKGGILSTKFSTSGSFSAIINKDNPYGLTI